MIQTPIAEVLFHLYPGLQTCMPLFAGAIVALFTGVGFFVWKHDKKRLNQKNEKT